MDLSIDLPMDFIRSGLTVLLAASVENSNQDCDGLPDFGADRESSTGPRAR